MPDCAAESYVFAVDSVSKPVEVDAVCVSAGHRCLLVAVEDDSEDALCGFGEVVGGVYAGAEDFDELCVVFFFDGVDACGVCDFAGCGVD